MDYAGQYDLGNRNAADGLPRLIAVVEVDPENRVQCQQPGCGHGVYKRIHVVQVVDRFLVLGSTCFAKHYANLDTNDTTYGTGDGRKLTPEERAMLESNTLALIAKFEAERVDLLAQENARQENIRFLQHEQAQAAKARHELAKKMWAAAHAATPKVAAMPWGWYATGTSMALFTIDGGYKWLRVQHRNGRHFLMPWPAFDGWDESFPRVVGIPDAAIGGYAIGDGTPALIEAVSYLRKHSTAPMRVGIWRELAGC